MAASNLNLGKASGGVLNIQPADGTTTTSIVLPASGTVATNEYVNSNNLGNGSTTFNGFGGTGFKNYIINGNFNIWQYGTSQTSSGYGSDDRWFNLNVGSTKTHSQVYCTDTERALFNAINFSRTVVSSIAGASNYAVKQQKIEDVTKLAGKTITISFWAKADSNKNIAIDLEQNFGTGGTPSSTVTGIGSQKIALTTTWQKKTITVTIPSIVGKTLGTNGVNTSFLGVDFWFDTGSSFDYRTVSLGQQSGTFDIAQVQLEEGTVATPFEQRPIGLELSLCQRYYEKSFPIGVAPASNIGYFRKSSNNLGFSVNSYFGFTFVVEKRVVPTMVFYDPLSDAVGNVTIFKTGTKYTSTSLTAETLTTKFFDYIAVNSSVTDGGVLFCFTASAEL